MIYGIDVSHWQNKIDWKKVKKAGYDFAFCKCTQGVKYKDPNYEENKEGARKAGLIFGAYHFANANIAEVEAENFCKNVGDLKEGEIVILDYETHAIKDPASWCLSWITCVEKELGFKPMLYTYHEFLKKYDWKKVSDNNNGLWAARYGLQQQKPNNLFKPATGSWSFYAIWQYCSKGKVDGISGNVDLNTTELPILRRYGKPQDGIQPVPAVVEAGEINQSHKPMLDGKKTYIGIIITLLGVVGFTKYIAPADLDKALTALFELGGLALATYGRYKATK